MRPDYTAAKITRKEMKLFSLLVIALIAIFFSGCALKASPDAQKRLSEDEKHRLYSAALAASESPLDTDTFKKVCREIEIVDAHGRANDQYMAFVSEHVNWGLKPETEQFRQEINTQEKAREYLSRHLP